MEVYKVIRDSVHGNIELERSFVEYILDTAYFQRLRRIEQSSVRAIYPCARHDRFTHSLGVYHVGTKIVDHLRPQISKIKPLDKNQIEIITKSYLIACLLHDIAHAPFSHTFEKYYGARKGLYEELCNSLGVKLNLTTLQVEEIKEHEYASAILVADKFKDAITSQDKLGGDREFICRMIIGASYPTDNAFHQVCNCFIKLLHGEVDADRLDYACRDIWSSGYKSVSIDINRVIHAMHIELYCEKYELCFNHNVIGDIRNIMELKRFQVSHIFNHHTIVYDQELLVQAAETMAKKFAPPRTQGVKALSQIICLDAVSKEKEIQKDSYKFTLRHICDDDLFFLMKRDNSKYFQELSSRKYTRFALWKSPEEFYKLFPNADKTINIQSKELKNKVKEAIKPLKTVLNPGEILTREVTYKEIANLDKLLIMVHGEVKPFCDVCHEIFSEKSQNKKFEFTYLYLPKPKDASSLDKVRKTAVELIKPVIDELFYTPYVKKNITTQIQDYIKGLGYEINIFESDFTEKDISNMRECINLLAKESENQIANASMALLEAIINSCEIEEHN